MPLQSRVLKIDPDPADAPGQEHIIDLPHICAEFRQGKALFRRCPVGVKIVFNFSPILIIISCWRNASSVTTTSTIGIFVRNVHGMRLTQSTNYASKILYATWAETSISWYSVDGENDQLNYDGTTYHYLALG